MDFRRHFTAVLFVLLPLHAGAATAQTPGWTTYQGPGFTISLPPDWKADPSFLDKGYGFFQGQAAAFAVAARYEFLPEMVIEVQVQQGAVHVQKHAVDLFPGHHG